MERWMQQDLGSEAWNNVGYVSSMGDRASSAVDENQGDERRENEGSQWSTEVHVDIGPFRVEMKAMQRALL